MGTYGCYGLQLFDHAWSCFGSNQSTRINELKPKEDCHFKKPLETRMGKLLSWWCFFSARTFELNHSTGSEQWMSCPLFSTGLNCFFKMDFFYLWSEVFLVRQPLVCLKS